MASYLLTQHLWKPNRGHDSCIRRRAMWRCAVACSTNPRRLRPRGRMCPSYPTVLRNCRGRIEMSFVRFTRVGFIVVCCSLATEAFARIAPTSDPNSSSTIVVIDAGHGGHDLGGIPGQVVAEKTMTLDVAKRLQAALNANGYRTIMTRESDVFVPLATRVAMANAYRNAIFVCIHFNSARRSGASGIETYFYSSRSLALASAIHYCLSHASPSSNRGVRRRGYYVLRRTTVPAVLVECGFLTNPTQEQYAQSANYRQMLAEQIARGIRSRTMGGGGGGRYASNDTVPNQPYIDQTHVRDPDISGHKGRAKSTKSSKSKKTTS